MSLLIAALVAGFLTVLAPCILPLLPVLLVGSLDADGKAKRVTAIIAGLTLSVIVFSLLLKATSALLGVPQVVWQVVSASILVLFGLAMLLPAWWERVGASLSTRSGLTLQAARQHRGWWGDFLLGASLGPVFNSCSPTYALIVAAILPASFITGLGYLVAYAVGLAMALLLIALLGRGLVAKLGWVANPTGWFRKLTGALLILAGLAIVLGADKKFQTFVLDNGYYEPIMRLEERIHLPK